MKEIIPLKKDLLFKSKVYEITNINVDHDYKIDDNVLSGTLYINGSYIMTEASVIEEEFDFKVPFSIVLSDKIDKSTIRVEIDDFKYEVSKDTLKITSELELSCEEIIIEEEIPEKKDEEIMDKLNEELNNYFEVKETKEDLSNKMTKEIISNEEVYSTYKVYIVKEGDTIDTICNKYNCTKENLSEYNDITNINVGNKIIIPDNEV